MIGKTISHYKIVEKIGEGGMGVVYKALDLNLDRYVALKFLPVHMGKDENQKRRFINEAKAVSALDHPNICTIHEIEETKIDAGEDSSERIFITMAYYDGETLEEKLSGGTPISTNEAINIVLQIAQGLNKAHEMDIVHRDIKPANIIVPKDAEVKIVDFGLAKLKGQPRLTKQDSTLGTITYMSPEQAEGTEVDIRTDIWSLGIIFYELLTGKSPFAADYDQAVIYNIVNTTLVSVTELNKDIPDELGNIVSTCLEKNRENRYQTFKEFISDLLKVVKKHNYIIKTRSGELHPADLTTKEKSTIPLRPAFAAVMIIFLIVAAILFWPESNYSAYEKAYFSRHYLEAQEASRDERSLTNIKAHRYFLLSTGKAKEKSLAQPTKQEYRTLLADNPNSAHAHYYLGLVYFLSPQNRAERDSVWMLYDQAEDLGLKSIYLKLDQLNYYVAKGFQQQATEMVDILLNNYPENPDVMFEVGYLYEGASDTSNARASYEKSITLYSDFVSAHMGLFRLALERNDITSAKVYLDRAVEINSENTLVVSEKKKLYVKEGKLDEAENYLKSVIDGFGRDDGRYYEYLCRLYQDQDLFEKCMDLKSLVADRFPENSYFASLEETLQNRKDWLHFLDTQKNDKKSVQWFYDFDEALAKASREGKPVFIEFYQSDQLWSGDFDRKIYTDPKNQKFLKSYIPLKLNGNLEIDLVYKYDVDWFPATLIVNEDGEPLLPIRYFQYFSDASEIFTDLNNGLSNYRKYVEGKSSLEQRITEVSTIDDALLLSKSKNLPVMAVVISRNSEWSQKLINETFNHPLVQPELRSVILVKMDQATSKRFVREKGITYFPSILFMDSKGKTIYQVQGYQKPKVLVRLISDINYSFANNQAYQGKVNWLYDLEEATFFAAVQKKEVFIFINADWCPYCLWMMKYVFTDPLIIEKLNTDFIPLELDHRLDPEQVNSLGVKSFPTFVILNPDQSEIFRINGRTDVPELLATLDLEKRKPLYAVLGREKYQEFYKYENLVSKFLYRRYSMSAIRASRKQIAVYPEYWQSYLNIAEAYRRLNDPARMLSYYIQALEKGADIDRPFVENVLKAYFQLNDLSGFKKWLSGEIENRVRNKDELAFLNNTYSEYHEIMQNRATAIKMAEKAVAVKPEDVEGYIRLGRLYYLENRLEKAKTYLNKAIELSADDPRSHFYLGLIAEKKSDIKGKQKNFNLARQKHKKVSEKVGWRVNYHSYPGYHLYPGCLKLIEEGYRYKILFTDQFDGEEQVELKNDFAYFLAKQNMHLDEALRLVNEALKSAPGNDTILDTKAVILYQKGEFQKAHDMVREYEDRIQLFELRGDPTFAYYLGKIKWGVGDKDKAKYYFDFILNSSNPDILSKKYKLEIDNLLAAGSQYP